MILELDPQADGIPVTGDHGIYGAIMELGMGDAVATLVSLTDGTTSLYVSTGGGIIGAGEHDTVRTAAAAWIDKAAQVSDTMETTEVLLPQDGTVTLGALSRSGHRVRSITQDEAERDTGELGALWNLGQNVLTAVQEAEEAPRRR